MSSDVITHIGTWNRHVPERDQQHTRIIVMVQIELLLAYHFLFGIRYLWLQFRWSFSPTTRRHPWNVMNGLFEDLAVGRSVLLAVDSDWLVDSPHVIDKLLVLWLGVVKLGELVALPVCRNVSKDSNGVYCRVRVPGATLNASSNLSPRMRKAPRRMESLV